MSGVYEIYVKDHFAAAHSLKGYDGNCSRIHGHNWIVEAYIQCTKLIYKELSLRLNTDHIKVTRIMVFESPGCGSSYQEI